MDMPAVTLHPDQLSYKPLTAAEWPDFVQLFEEHGPQNGCWCMYWRIRRADCQHQFGEGNKLAFKHLVDSGNEPGILAYNEGQTIGWCSIARRAEFVVLDRSPTLKRVDDQPVWAITCFFVSKPYRRLGLTELLIQAAVRYATGRGARIIEAYPLRTEITKLLPYERFMGIESTFERLGFQVVTRRSDRRPLMRLDLGNIG
jgi:GNAT superfamily N-acetyltransferase